MMRYLFLVFIFTATIAALSCGGANPSSSNEEASSPPAQRSSPTMSIPEDNRIRIPKIGVDAPLSLKVVDAGGRLPEPDGTDDIAIYDFSGFSMPGFGGLPGSGNAVLSGRPDSGTLPCQNGTVPPPCKAVLFDLVKLVPGDEIFVFWEKRQFEYRVASACWLERILSLDDPYRTTDEQALTILTAGGTFANGGYSHNLFVRAESTAGSFPPGCPYGSTAPTTTPLGLTFDRKLEPGSTGPGPNPTHIPYRFVLSGLPLQNGDQIRAGLSSSPPLPAGFSSRPPNFLIIYVPPTTPAQDYRLTYKTPNGREVTATLTHTP